MYEVALGVNLWWVEPRVEVLWWHGKTLMKTFWLGHL